MLRWIGNKILEKSIEVQKKEIARFIDNIKAMDGSEVGSILATATHIRNQLIDQYDWDLQDPILLCFTKPNIAIEINQLIKAFQENDDTVSAAGMMVWLFTVRAAMSPDIRGLGRELWGQLERGFDHVEEARIQILSLGGKIIDIDGYEKFPIGMEPTPKE